ncbi:MAG: hypothetical protein PF518_09200, partial [Spirochaetaceae bacterium]|nr:hypothetical protein [Spirochaetaceae bacterium]
MMGKSINQRQLYLNKIEKYEHIFDSMEEMFQEIELLYDENGKAIDYSYLQVNSAFEKLVHMKKEVLVGQKKYLELLKILGLRHTKELNLLELQKILRIIVKNLINILLLRP